MIVGTFVLVCVALPYMTIFFAGAAWVAWRIRQRYLLSSREVKRLDGITRSPVYAMLSSNIKGLSTIRAFKGGADFQQRYQEAIDWNGTWRTTFILTSRWVSARMDGMGVLSMFLSVVLSLLLVKEVTAIKMWRQA